MSTGTINHIQGLLWNDESRCCLDFNDGRRYVWSKKNERFRHIGRQTRDLKPSVHDRFCGVSDLVWAGISYDGSTDLYVTRNGSLTGVCYMNEIIAPIVKPEVGAIGDFILMDCNARPQPYKSGQPVFGKGNKLEDGLAGKSI